MAVLVDDGLTSAFPTKVLPLSKCFFQKLIGAKYNVHYRCIDAFEDTEDDARDGIFTDFFKICISTEPWRKAIQVSRNSSTGTGSSASSAAGAGSSASSVPAGSLSGASSTEKAVMPVLEAMSLEDATKLSS